MFEKPVYYIILIGVCIITCFICLSTKDRVFPAVNHYQSTGYNINETMNDIMNGIAFGPALNGEKAGNIDAVYIEFTFAAAGVEYVIPHNLGRIPSGRILVDQTTHASYGSLTHMNWTAGTIGLTSNTAGVTATFLIF